MSVDLIKSGKTQNTKPARMIRAKPIKSVLGSQGDWPGLALGGLTVGARVEVAGPGVAGVAASYAVACNGPTAPLPAAASVALVSNKFKRSPKFAAAPC